MFQSVRIGANSVKSYALGFCSNQSQGHQQRSQLWQSYEPRLSLSNSFCFDITMALGGKQATHLSQLLTTTSSDLPHSTGCELFCPSVSSTLSHHNSAQSPMFSPLHLGGEPQIDMWVFICSVLLTTVFKPVFNSNSMNLK